MIGNLDFPVFSNVMLDVFRERLHQETKHPNQTPAAPEISDDKRLTFIVEEIGEVARAMQDGNPEDVLAEVRQVAALAVAWLESGKK